MEKIGQPWMRWTLLEAATKTSSKAIQKVVGNLSSTLGHTLVATFVVGLVQTLSGLIVCKRQKTPLLDWQTFWGSAVFGMFAVMSTVLSFSVFLLGGDIGVNTFFITLSIIPGAMIDQFFFGKKHNAREVFGIALAIVGGYIVLGTPSLSEAAALPLWVWLSVATACTTAINQGITQKMRKVDPFAKNFWGGLTTMALCIVGLALSGKLHLFGNTDLQTLRLYGWSMVIGVIVVGMWAFNLLSYRDGAAIALKKLVLNWAYLGSAMFVGVIVFHEELTAGKIGGLVIYGVAFMFLDKGTWEYLSKKLRSRET